jgi:hypothetical protein
MRKAKIKNYNDKEINELTNAYNKLVKSEYQIDEKTLIHKISEVDCSVNPDYHIPSIDINKVERLKETYELELAWELDAGRSFHYNPLFL